MSQKTTDAPAKPPPPTEIEARMNHAIQHADPEAMDRCHLVFYLGHEEFEALSKKAPRRWERRNSTYMAIPVFVVDEQNHFALVVNYARV